MTMDKVIKMIDIDYNTIANKTFFITGATGLIGKNYVRVLCQLCNKNNKRIRIVLSGRNKEKLIRIKELYKSNNVTFEIHVGDVLKPIIWASEIDYIVHAAAITSSKDFVQQPVEVIETTYLGTKNVLEFAKQKNIESMIYLSSMEVYGTPRKDDLITESYGTNLQTTSVRSCYPESKRLCESLCVSYCNEYGVPVRIIRLTQTFGAGVNINDGRVFAEFARCAINKQDIILKTKGLTKRSYLSVDDASSAIMIVLLKGTSGEVYNAANDETYCTIYDMACLVAKEISNDEIQVKICEDDISKYGYAPELHMNLSVKKLRALGWKPYSSLIDMYREMIDGFSVDIEE